MKKIGIISITRNYKETPSGIISSSITWKKDKPCFITRQEETNDVVFMFSELNNEYTENFQHSPSKTKGTRIYGIVFNYKPTDNLKDVTFNFDNGESKKYNLTGDRTAFLNELYDYIDSEYTRVPSDSSLLKAAELLADDEFDDI